MKKTKSLSESITAFKDLIQNLFKKMPVLFLVIIYLLDLLIRSYLSAGWSTTYLMGLLILTISVGIYTATKSFSETTLSFVLGILTVYTIDWSQADITLFVLLYFAYIIIVFYIYLFRLSSKQESILIQAACKLDMDDYKNVYNRLRRISQETTNYNQLSLLERCEIIRYLAFRQVMIGEYEAAINVIELIKNVCQADIIACCEIYYGFYAYCYNQRPSHPNISKQIERMFDEVTTLTISYQEFFEIFSETKRILVEEKIPFDKYLIQIKSKALKGYSSKDIITMLTKEYLEP